MTDFYEAPGQRTDSRLEQNRALKPTPPAYSLNPMSEPRSSIDSAINVARRLTRLRAEGYAWNRALRRWVRDEPQSVHHERGAHAGAAPAALATTVDGLRRA